MAVVGPTVASLDLPNSVGDTGQFSGVAFELGASGKYSFEILSLANSFRYIPLELKEFFSGFVSKLITGPEYAQVKSPLSVPIVGPEVLVRLLGAIFSCTVGCGNAEHR